MQVQMMRRRILSGDRTGWLSEGDFAGVFCPAPAAATGEAVFSAGFASLCSAIRARATSRIRRALEGQHPKHSFISRAPGGVKPIWEYSKPQISGVSGDCN